MFSPADVTMQEQSFSYANVTEQSILGIRVDFVDFEFFFEKLYLDPFEIF